MSNKASAAARAVGPVVIYPGGAEIRYSISGPTRWRWEQAGKLPPRDVFVGGKAIGWRPETLEEAERGPAASGSSAV
jgi:hypothetical protein